MTNTNERNAASLHDASGHRGVVVVEGPDAIPFLQAILTQDVSAVAQGRVARSEILDRASRIRSDFLLARATEHRFVFLVDRQADPEVSEKLAKILGEFHFSEDLQITCDPEAIVFLSLGEPPPESSACPRFAWNFGGHEAWWILPDANLAAAWRAKSDLLLDEDSFDLLLLEAGEARFGVDFTSDVMLLELGDWEERLSLTKGCYPGQEIVARTHSQGEVRKRLIGLKWDGPASDAPPPLGTEIRLGGRRVGELRRCRHSPKAGAWIALAWIQREQAYPGVEASLEWLGVTRPATLVRPPFVHPRGERIDALLTEGHLAFHKSGYAAALAAFEEVLRLSPRHVEALEARAVTLERLENADAALAANQRLAEVEPNAVMARTNLSRLYMKKGFIEKAEKEKNRATLLGFRLAAAEAAFGRKAASGTEVEAPGPSAEALAEAAKKAEDAERIRKKAMFDKVLAMDPEDEIARYGLGKFHHDAGDFAGALPHFEVLLRVSPRHSQGHLLHGKCLLALGRNAEAAEVLEKGVVAAREQGELMPLRAMEELRKGFPRS